MELIESSALSLTYFIMGTLIFGGIRIARGLNNKSVEVIDDKINEESENGKIKKL